MAITNVDRAGTLAHSLRVTKTTTDNQIVIRQVHAFDGQWIKEEVVTKVTFERGKMLHPGGANLRCSQPRGQ